MTTYMKYLLCILLLSLLAFAAHTATASELQTEISQTRTEQILVDFGINIHESVSPDPNGNWWNNLSTDSALAPTGTIANLRTAANAFTGIQLSVSGFGMGANNAGTTVPDTSALGSLGVISATRDNFFVGTGTGVVSLSGLSANHYYRLECFGSRDATDSRITLYSVSGNDVVSASLQTSGAGIGIQPQPNANRSALAVLENVRPTTAGLLTLSVTIQSGSYAYLGALRITQLGEITASNQPPEASNVIVVGAPAVGRNIVTYYNYYDADGDMEGASEISWQVDTPPFTSPNTIGSGSSSSFQISVLAGEYIRAAITPKALSGELTGTVTYSDWLGPIAEADAVTVFHIGNSFTRWGNIPLQLQNLAEDAGNNQVGGAQLSDGMGLKYQWENGLQGGVWTRGTPSRLELETGSWDWLVLQPMSREWQPATLDSLIRYARLYAELADANATKVLLYQYWNYLDEDIGVQNDINEAFSTVSAALAVSGLATYIIPAGEAFASAVERIPELDKPELYQDNIHPNDIGYYLSALLHYSVIYRQSPLGLTNSAISSDVNNDDAVVINTELASALQQLAWDTARYHTQSGVTAGRFATWASSLPEGFRDLLDVPYADGITNIRRWAHGLPQQSGTGLELFPGMEQNSGTATLTYGLGPDAEDAGALIIDEWNSSLGEESWTTTPPAEFLRFVQDDTVNWQLNGSSSAVFHRNRIKLP